jgi:hypothetical protein
LAFSVETAADCEGFDAYPEGKKKDSNAPKQAKTAYSMTGTASDCGASDPYSGDTSDDGKEEDPNAPKQAQTAYMFFNVANREQVTAVSATVLACLPA